MVAVILNPNPVWDRLLQVFVFNEEFLVIVGHYPTVNASLPFVHTARRCYRLGFAFTHLEGRQSASLSAVVWPKI